jgi:predicted ester cyclase
MTRLRRGDLQRQPEGEWAGIPATGRPAIVHIACLYEFEEDRLVCERVWFDFATILRHLGVLAS